MLKDILQQMMKIGTYIRLAQLLAVVILIVQGIVVTDIQLQFPEFSQPGSPMIFFVLAIGIIIDPITAAHFYRRRVKYRGKIAT